MKDSILSPTETVEPKTEMHLIFLYIKFYRFLRHSLNYNKFKLQTCEQAKTNSG